MKLTYEIADIAPYINWAYFYYAWGMSGKPEAEKDKLRLEAEDALHQMEGRYHTYALFELFDAYSEGDDIILEGVRSHYQAVADEGRESS